MIEPVALLPCPFCGKAADIEDDDTLYPSGIGWKFDAETGMRSYHKFREVPKEQWCWSMHCPAVAGGCGAEISGESREEAIANWNERAIPPGFAIVPVEQVKDAERYAWLRKGSPRSNRLPHITQYPYQAKIDENRIPQVWDIEGYHPERLDAAIDAAMLTAAAKVEESPHQPGAPISVDADVTEVRYMTDVPRPWTDREILVDETKGE